MKDRTAMASYQPQPSAATAPAAPPLELPHYGIGFIDAIKRGFKKYASFAGRASRSEYWWWTLFTFLTYTVLGLLAYIVGIATSRDGGRTPGVLAVPLIILFAVFAPRHHRAYARSDGSAATRRWIQRTVGTAFPRAVPRRVDHYDFRTDAELASRS
jgi:hypothetical protein